MPAVVEPLGPAHVAALRTLLTRDIPHNMYLLGLMEEFGVVGNRSFTFWGRFNDGELTAACFVGGNGGLVVPSASSALHVGDIAKRLAGEVQLKSTLGEQSAVDALVKHLHVKPTLARQQKLFVVSPNELGPFTNPLLRLATESDLPQLVPIAAACVKELMNRDPLEEDKDGFELRVRQRVRSHRTYVLEEKGRLVFKLDVGSRSQFGAELENLYTIPEERRRGHAILCLGQISRFLMSSLPRLTVRIDEANTRFQEIARKVGFLQGRSQKLLWV